MVRAGYGSLAEIEALDTPDFLDLVEFEAMTRDLEFHAAKQGSKGQ